MCEVFSHVLYRLDAPDLLGLDKGLEHPGDWGRKLWSKECVVCLNMECTSTPSGRLARMDGPLWFPVRSTPSCVESVCLSVRLSNLRTRENSNFSTFRSSERKNRERCFRYRYWSGGGRGFRGHVTFAGSILQSRLKTLFLSTITSNLNAVQPTTKIWMNISEFSL